MFKFSKTTESETLEMVIDSDFVTHEDLRDAFLRFLRGCGYILPALATLEVVEEGETVVLQSELEELHAGTHYSSVGSDDVVDDMVDETVEELHND